MTTLHDLRDSLNQHADLVDHDLSARPAAVHQRVRVVRRNRRVAVAGVAAVAVAAALAVPPIAARQSPQYLDGLRAPDSVGSLGFTYDFADGVTGQGSAELELGRSDEPRLITWDSASGDVKIKAPDQRAFTSTGGFSDFTIVYPGEKGTWRATGEGTVGLAVYDLGALPAGDASDGAVFRDEIAGAERIASAWATDGATEVSVEVTLPAGEIGVSGFCAGAPRGTWVHVELADDGPVSWGQCADGGPDAGQWSGSWDASQVGEAGEVVSGRAWLTDGSEGPRVPVTGDVRLGVGFYALSTQVAELGPVEIPELLERDGHVWRLDAVVGSDAGTGRVETTVEAGPGSPALVELVGAGRGGLMRGSLGDNPDSAMSQANRLGARMGLGVTFTTVEAAGRIAGDDPERVVGLAVYRRAD